MKEKLKWLKFRISFNWSGFLQHMLGSVFSRTLQLISLLFMYAGSYLWLFSIEQPDISSQKLSEDFHAC